MGERQWVDVRRAAAEAEVSPRTIRRWLDEGKLTRYTVPANGRVRIAWSELTFVCQPLPNDDKPA